MLCCLLTNSYCLVVYPNGTVEIGKGEGKAKEVLGRYVIRRKNKAYSLESLRKGRL